MTVNGRNVTKVDGRCFYKDEYDYYLGWLAGTQGKKVFAKDNDCLRTSYWKGYTKGKSYIKYLRNHMKQGPKNPYFTIEPNSVDPETEEYAVV